LYDTQWVLWGKKDGYHGGKKGQKNNVRQFEKQNTHFLWPFEKFCFAEMLHGFFQAP
jgi:hypothetical protein